jgi:hypothetical protein
MHLSRVGATLVGPAAIALALAPIALSSATAAGASSAGHSSAGHTKVVANCLKPAYKPKKIILTCADANSDLSHIHYASWTATRASGRARLDFNDCNPNCASGTFEHQPVTFVLTRVRDVKGTEIFTRVVVTQKTTYSPGI